MSRHTLIGVLVAVAVGWASAAFAQHGGTEAQQDACTPDVFRLCQAYIPDEAPIVACLRANRVNLSPACSQVFFPMRADTSRMAHPRKRRHHHVH